MVLQNRTDSEVAIRASSLAMTVLDEIIYLHRSQLQAGVPRGGSVTGAFF
jgi:hypothetical protein